MLFVFGRPNLIFKKYVRFNAVTYRRARALEESECYSIDFAGFLHWNCCSIEKITKEIINHQTLKQGNVMRQRKLISDQHNQLAAKNIRLTRRFSEFS